MPTPERCSSEEDSQDFWPTWNSDPPKMDNLRTEAHLGHKGQEVGAHASEVQPPLQEEGKADSGKHIKQEEAGSPATLSDFLNS